MAVAWTDITNGQVAAGAAVTTALMTALRDNPEGIAQRATGAPKIFGNAYDYQEFTSSGTWTKPSNAETGDKVIVQVVGGGGGGYGGSIGGGGGGGGGGAMQKFDDIDDLPSSVSLVVGAGGAGGEPGAAGGLSSFGSDESFEFLRGGGGTAGLISLGVNGGSAERAGIGASAPVLVDSGADQVSFYNGERGGLGAPSSTQSGGPSITGGGGGGGAGNTSASQGGGPSMYAGGGGLGGGTGVGPAALRDGMFPGGGGGGYDTSFTGPAGSGANGVVRVWCIREEA